MQVIVVTHISRKLSRLVKDTIGWPHKQIVNIWIQFRSHDWLVHVSMVFGAASGCPCWKRQFSIVDPKREQKTMVGARSWGAGTSDEDSVEGEGALGADEEVVDVEASDGLGVGVRERPKAAGEGSGTQRLSANTSSPSALLCHRLEYASRRAVPGRWPASSSRPSNDTSLSRHPSLTPQRRLALSGPHRTQSSPRPNAGAQSEASPRSSTISPALIASTARSCSPPA